MKRNLFYVATLAVATMGLTACSSDEPDQQAGSAQQGEAQYLAINVMPTETAGSRAASDYEQGTTDENAVTNALFFFYDENGNAVNVTNNQTDAQGNAETEVPQASNVNYVFVQNLSTNGDNMPNISGLVSPVLILHCDANKFPKRVVTYCNVEVQNSKPVMPAAYASINDLKAGQANYVKANMGAGDFFMSSSVYSNEATPAAEVNYSTLETANFGQSVAAAKQRPINVYVERAMAKVTFGLDAKDNTYTNGYEVVNGVKYFCITPDETDATKKLYARVDGMALADMMQTAYTLKHINTSWTDANLFTGWNAKDLFRSFYGVSPETQGTLANGSWNQAAGNGNFAAKYLNENAYYGSTGKTPSKVLIAATICDHNYNPTTICEYFSQQMSIDDLKTVMLNALASSGNTFKVNGTNIAATDIEFTLAHPNAASRRYEVKAVLTSTAAAATLTNAAGTAITADQANTMLAALGYAKIWNGGKTYYYFDITHLTPAANVTDYTGKAVVRNHVYKTFVSSIKGLGTPTFDPDEPIVPEKPENDDTYVAARINVLSWRIVEQHHDLNWD